MKKLFLMLVVLILLVPTGCSKNDEEIPIAGSELEFATAEPELDENIAQATIPPDVEFLNPSIFNDFALTMLRTYSHEEDNIVFSPTSIATSLVMLRIGANYDTAYQIDALLNLPELSPQELLYSSSNLPDYLSFSNNSTKLANGIFLGSGPSINEHYAAALEHYMDAKITFVDLTDVLAVDNINEWVKDTTDNNITNTVDLLPSDMIMMLLNAVAFDLTWEQAFDEKDTTTMPFILEDTKGVAVPMMSGEINLETYSGDDGYACYIPYSDNKQELWILMPPEDLRITEFLATINNSLLTTWRGSAQEELRTLRMPKLAFSNTLDMIPILKQLGINDIFDPTLCDLTAMGADLYLQTFTHSTVIVVDEDGDIEPDSNNAATSIRSLTPENLLAVDRPYVFMTVDVETGSILQTGIMRNPLEAK